MKSARIITPSAPLMSEPDARASRETDALYGESVTILEEKEAPPEKGKNGWSRVTLETDGYTAWVSSARLGRLPQATHHIIAPRVLLTQSPDIKSPASDSLPYLPLGALIHAKTHDDKTLAIYDDHNDLKGFIPHQHALELGTHCRDFVAVAESLIGVPYRWGGRDSIGIDCSALIQLSLAACGIKVMRNSGDQEQTIGTTGGTTGGTTLADKAALYRGDLVFWRGHVGVVTDPKTLLHANMHHGAVATEPLEEALPRLETVAGPITRLARIGASNLKPSFGFLP